MTTMMIYTKDNVPPRDWEGWRRFRKTRATRMFQVKGPFMVETREGTLERRDGWLAVDPDGYPYPIDPAIHDVMYEEVT